MTTLRASAPLTLAALSVPALLVGCLERTPSSSLDSLADLKPVSRSIERPPGRVETSRQPLSPISLKDLRIHPADAPPLVGRRVQVLGSVVASDGKHHFLWRGAAPTAEVFDQVVMNAAKRGRTVTFIDLRTDGNPYWKDDCSKLEGRLTPDEEKKRAQGKANVRYLRVNAMKADLIKNFQLALGKGDVFFHCMHGRNRTGYVFARLCVASGKLLNAEGIPLRDLRDGTARQKGLQQ